MGGGDVRARAGLDVDGRQAVGDDVVEVAGDAQPLLGHEPARLLLAGLLQEAGPFLQAEEVVAAGAGRVADEPGRDAPREVDGVEPGDPGLFACRIPAELMHPAANPT